MSASPRFYLVCGVAAALTMAAVDPASKVPMIGASGAISGVLAAYVLLYPRARVTVVVPLGHHLLSAQDQRDLGGGLLVRAAAPQRGAVPRAGQPGVAWWAHVGGFVAGGALTPLFKSAHVAAFSATSGAAPGAEVGAPVSGQVRPNSAITRIVRALAAVSARLGTSLCSPLGPGTQVRLELTQSETGRTDGQRPEQRPMKHRNSHLLVGYWSRLRRGRDRARSDRYRSARHQAHALLCLHPGGLRPGAPGLPSGRHLAVRTLRRRAQGHELPRPLGSPEPRRAEPSAEAGADQPPAGLSCPRLRRPASAAWSSWKRCWRRSASATARPRASSAWSRC